MAFPKRIIILITLVVLVLLAAPARAATQEIPTQDDFGATSRNISTNVPGKDARQLQWEVHTHKVHLRQVERAREERKERRLEARAEARSAEREEQQSYATQSSSLNWSALRECEAGHYGYTANTGNGYYGAYQFSLSTWQAQGGSGLPSEASPDEQDMRAQMLYDEAGSSPWPNCGSLL